MTATVKKYLHARYGRFQATHVYDDGIATVLASAGTQTLAGETYEDGDAIVGLHGSFVEVTR